MIKFEFGFRFFLNVAIASFSIMQVLFIVSESAESDMSIQRSFLNLFIENDERIDPDYSRKKFLYTPTEVKDFFLRTKANYYNINDLTLTKLEFLINKEDIRATLSSLYVTYIQLQDNNGNAEPALTQLYLISQESNGPFDKKGEDLFTFLNQMMYMKNEFNLVCSDGHRWLITQTYDFSLRGHITVTVHFKNMTTIYSSTAAILFDNYYLIHFIVVLLSLLSIVIFLKEIQDQDEDDKFNLPQSQTFLSHYSALSNPPEAPNSHSLKIKLSFWTYFCFAGNIAQMLGGLISIIHMNKECNGSLCLLLISTGMLMFNFNEQ